MKKIILAAFMSAILFKSYSQGLENIIVEKYYVSDASDTAVNADGGALPIGSVTYRVYADLMQGYRFQAVYGVPDHEMRIQTTTLFFNNEDRGATSPTYSKTQAANNTVMLDSWLSVGSACNGQYGVLKAEDDGAATVMNADGVLQNADTSAGIPVSVEDGLIAGTPEGVTFVGITTEIAMFDNMNDGTNGPLFSSFNGSWASLNGSVGPDTVTNKVLVAQITTDGTFSFELNMQIGTPSGGVENYVAMNPVASEILFPALVYNSLQTSIEKPDLTDALFTVYPNPASNNLSLEIMANQKLSDAAYRILDSNGKLIDSHRIGNVTDYYYDNINISDLSAGKYYVELISNGKSSANSFIKQ
jgi:hypothetical protein